MIDPPKAKRPPNRVAAMIGGGLGVAAALAIGKLIGFENFWLGVALVGGCAGLGGFLAQKIATK